MSSFPRRQAVTWDAAARVPVRVSDTYSMSEVWRTHSACACSDHDAVTGRVAVARA
jgi:hypothetical protein